jgi:hypothetical protein
MKTRLLALLAVVILPLVAGSMTMTAKFDKGDLSFSSTDGYDVIELRGGVPLVEPGMPRLPRVVQAVAIPAGAMPVSVEVMAEEWATIPGTYNVVAAQPDVPLPMPGRTFVPRLFPRNAAVYGSASPYPATTIRLLEPGTMNGYRIAHVELHPVRYIPATGELRLATRLSYRLVYSEQGIDDVVPTAEQKAEYGKMVRSLVVNPHDVNRFAPHVARSALTTLPAGNYPYVVISESPLDTVFQRLADWKKLKGLPDTVVSVSWITANYTGYDNSEKVRNFIIDAHSTWGADYVLLGGSGDQKNSGQNIVPARRCFYAASGEGAYPDEDSIPCDLYYAGLNGTWDANGNHVYGQRADNADMYADVHVGRASVYTVAQARNFVSKVLTYEKSAPTGYVKKMLLPTAILWSSYEERQTQESIARMTPTGWLDAKLYERTSTLSRARMIDSMNAGFGIGHWMGHGNETGIYMGGSPYLNSSDADGLTNGNKEGVHISIACFTGAWDEVSGGDCFAEHLMNRVGGGAVAMIMNSRYGWGAYTTQYVPGPSERLDTTFCSAVLNRNNYHDGPALDYAKSSWVPYADSGGKYDMQRWCIYELNLFGDPEMPLWTGEPGTLIAAHADTIATGTNIPFSVTITHATDAPVESARVVLWKGSEVYATGLTDASGQVTLVISPTTVGPMLVAATARNYYPLVDTVRVVNTAAHDVGCTRILAPTGTVDSGTVVTPACSVYNYGTTAETYSVRMKTGTGYNQTATVSSHAPGTRRYITFPSWTASPRGTFTVTCSTELSGDGANANDKQAGTVTVRVLDAACRALMAPTGTVDSGAVVTPACTAANYGTAAATFAVRMKVGAGYNQTASVTNLAAGARQYVTFPNWTASPRGNFAVTCSTELTGDMANANDKQTGTVTVRVTDAASVALLAPVGTVDSGTVVTPACTVANNGTTTASYTVRMKIGSGYNQTASVTSQAPGTKLYLTFVNWTAAQRGTNAVSCSTELSGDLVQANNRLTGSVDVRVRDVGCAQILAPAGTVDSGTVVTPACSVYNYGTTTETYSVRMKVGTGYNQTATVSSHAPGARRYITFPNWTASPRGTYAVTCSTELATDMYHGNDKATGSVTVGVPDVGCRALIAPSGMVDSGAVVTPACTVYNYGSVAASYTVRMKVGSGYNNTAAVSGHAVGTALYVTFPDWTASLPRGSHAVSCSTELAGDINPDNDKRTGTVTIGISDVAPVAVIAPAGTVDSGTTVTPACTVANYGTTTVSYTVRMKIGSGYNQTAAVANQTPGTKLYLTFADWAALQRGTNAVSCSTELDGDMVQANNKQTGSVAVRVRDVGCVRLAAPSGVVDSGTVVTPACTVYNYGTMAETYAVRMKIGTGYDQTAAVSNHSAGARRYVTFPDWTAGRRGPVAVSCSTELATDMQQGNDKQAESVDVRVRDVGCARIMAPVGTFDSGTVVTPACTVANYGSAVETYLVRMRIGAYSQAFTVVSHAPGARRYVTFPDWTAGPRGALAVTCSTELAADMQQGNDKQDGLVYVRVRDVGCTQILAPTGSLDSGTVITPACTLYNFGNTSESYSVRMRLGGSYDQTAAVTSHAAGAWVYVTFPDWTAGPGGPVAVICSTELAPDQQPGNDRALDSVFVNVRDIGVTTIIAPTGPVIWGAVITPACTVYNHGTGTESYTVRMRIGSGYDQTAAVADHAAGVGRCVTFPDWTAGPPGTHAVSCSTELAGDQLPANDKETTRVQVGSIDVGVTQIVAPTGRSDTSAIVVPQALVKNLGLAPATFDAFFRIDSAGTPTYLRQLAVTDLAPESSATLVFDTLPKPHHPGVYATCCSTYLAGDIDSSNNARAGTFELVALRPTPGWRGLAQMPLAPSGKTVKAGGWLAFERSNGIVYAGKGNKAADFYGYDVIQNAWHQLALAPGGAEGKPPYRGAVGCADGSGVIYVTKGNNTRGFWRYDAAEDSWRQLADVPLGAGRKKVKGGTDLVYARSGDTDYVYLLKGYNTEFYRYDPVNDGWQTLPDVPYLVRPKYDQGSFLVYDGDLTIYAHQAKYHGFFAYDLATGAWGPPLKGMPFIGASGRSKKSKDGGSGTWLDGSIYALKGGSTQEFWQYAAARDSWAELETMPQVAPGSVKKKKVKAGGDVTSHAATDLGSVVFALKGNATNELWMYTPAWGALLPRSGIERSGVMVSPSVEIGGASFTIVPNPLAAGFAMLRWSPGHRTAGSAVTVSVCDATGRTVLRSSSVTRNSTLTLDLRSLPTGVYVVRLSAAGFTATRKLVVQR